MFGMPVKIAVSHITEVEKIHIKMLLHILPSCAEGTPFARLNFEVDTTFNIIATS